MPNKTFRYATEDRRVVSASTDVVLSGRVDGDGYNRVEILGTGQINLGGGSGAVDASISRTGANAIATASGDTFAAQGGILPYGNAVFTATRAAFPVGQFAPTLTTGTDSTPTAGTVYFGALYLPVNYTCTGIGYLIGSVGGTDSAIVALYDSTGAVVANSALAGTTVGTTATVQEIAFTATYAAKGPGLYYVSISTNGNTCRLRLSVASGVRGGSAAGVFGTLDAITPPTANAAAPIAYVY